MNYRHAQILAPEDLGAAGTRVIDLDLDQPISRLIIKFTTTKASEGMSAPAPGNLTKIEIVDGSLPLVSMTGLEVQALAYYNNPGMSMEHGQHISTLSETDMFILDFGRWLWDTELAFLPSMFKNPQLRITWDEDLADTSVTANSLEVWAEVFDEKLITPMGFLRGLEWFDYTVGSDNSFEVVQLPEDHTIRQILVRAFRDGFEPWAQIDEARFSENEQQRIPFDYTNLEEYYRWMKTSWQPLNTPLITNITTTERVFYIPATDFYATVHQLGHAATNEIFLNTNTAKGGKALLIGSAAGQATGAAFGYLPWHCFQFPMGMPKDIMDWYDPTGKKPRLRLRANTSGVNGVGQVIVEQLFRY